MEASIPSVGDHRIAWRSVAACAAFAAGTGGVEAATPPVDVLRRELATLDLRAPPAPLTPAMQAYSVRYGLEVTGAVHRVGWFASGTNRLAAQVFVPPAASGTVVLVHGYFDHASVWRHLLPTLIRANLAVALYDQGPMP